MMTFWQGKHVVIVGAARQGLALAEYLVKKNAVVTLTDKKDELVIEEEKLLFEPDQVQWVLGGHPLSLLDDADLLAVSGGVPLTIPLIQQAQEMGLPVSNDSQIFLGAVPCPVIGITGSAGKTTTTLLIGKIAEAALDADRVWVGGNIGNPLIQDVERIKAQDTVVMELSSFQLELMTRAPQIACLLNITPNHLDRHETMAAYTAAKTRILSFQSRNDTAVINREDPGAWQQRDKVQGELITFGIHPPERGFKGTFVKEGWVCYTNGSEEVDLLPLASIQLRGEHNLLNVLAACAAAQAAGFPPPAQRAGVEGLKEVEHRLEFVRTWGGADWYNDSIATAPERSVAAVKSFSDPLILLAGGRDKDLPWEDFASLVVEKVRALVVFGEAAPLIRRQVEQAADRAGESVQITSCAGVREAVLAAAERVKTDDVVLFSPGGTSFDEFEDFAERGEQYKQWVEELK